MKYHEPVMLKEAVGWLNVRPGATYVDVTFGGGGHSLAILSELGDGRLYAFDRDDEAVNNDPGDGRLVMVKANYSHLGAYLKFHGEETVDGILADLGVSSHQFDEAGRGFSIRSEGPLDLRMDRQAALTAADVLNQYSAEELIRVFRHYGELPQARRIATAVVNARAGRQLETTLELVNLLKPFVPGREENKFMARVFQALRIEVNDELGALRELMAQAPALLKPGGRMVVISYHSLEDRIVKNFFRSGKEGGDVEKDFFGNKLVPWKVLTSKPIAPGEEELQRNNRSRSARMRVAEKI